MGDQRIGRGKFRGLSEGFQCQCAILRSACCKAEELLHAGIAVKLARQLARDWQQDLRMIAPEQVEADIEGGCRIGPRNRRDCLTCFGTVHGMGACIG